MSDYLWDRTGGADPEVARLEKLLGAYAHRPRPLELPAEAAPRPRRFKALRLAAAAALLFAVLAGALVALRHARRGVGPSVVKEEAPREVAPTLTGAPAGVNAPAAHAPQRRDERAAAGAGPGPRERVGPERANKFRRRSPVASGQAGARPRGGGPRGVAARGVAGDAERLQAKEQLVYALRLTSAKLGEVRRKVQGDEEARPAPPGRSRTR